MVALKYLMLMHYVIGRQRTLTVIKAANVLTSLNPGYYFNIVDMTVQIVLFCSVAGDFDTAGVCVQSGSEIMQVSLLNFQLSTKEL